MAKINKSSSQFAEDSKTTSGLTAFVGFGLIIFGLSAWNLFEISQGVRTIFQRNFRLEELSGKIIHSDEVLTMSARMAATTGDPQWESRYQKYDPELVAAIKEAAKLAPNAFKNILAEVNAANAKLVDLEKKSFSLVRQGKKEEAFNILFSNEYQTLRKIYADGSDRIIQAIRQENSEQIQAFNQRLGVSLIITLLTLPALIAAYFIVLQLIRSYLSERNRSEKAVLQSQDNLLQTQEKLLVLNKDLEAQTQSLFAQEQQAQDSKQLLQKRAMELLIEVDPISRGDLTVRAKVTEDEIGTVADSYNATVASLRTIVSQVQSASQQVLDTTNSSEISIQSLSSEALRQSLEITTALQEITEMSDSIRLVTSTAAKAEAAVEEATATVKEGEAAMNRTVDEFTAIRNTVADTAKKVEQLGESSQKISQVVNLITSFAAQTNILALNASMEAARAGEEGRGFAVVADEVRSLARQSAKASSEIEKMISDIQTQTKALAISMQIGAKQAETGTQIVDTARQSLDKIAVVSAQINSLVGAIAQAAVTQTQTSESVTKAMNKVAAIADTTSDEATHVVDGFKQLLILAKQLQSNVERFKVS
jgi:methyl-accepting chemotaxis protein